MTAPINLQSDATYPLNNNTRWSGARANGETGVETDLYNSDGDLNVTVHTVKTPAIPEAPAADSTGAKTYVLQVATDGTVTWVAKTIA